VWGSLHTAHHHFGALCFERKTRTEALLLENITYYEHVRVCRSVLHVALYWRETWSLTLSEEHKLQMLENKAPGKYLNLRNLVGSYDIAQQGI
jgi:hypothetical protein